MKTTFSEHTYYDNLLSENPVLIDLGSCKGAFAKHFYEKFPSSTIILLEPSKSNFSEIHLSGERITKHHAAISSETGKSITFYEDLNSEQNGSILFNYFKGVPYEVPTFSLEELARPFEKIDLVKMDVEGAEWDCLLNTEENTLQKIRQLTVEFHDFIDPSLAIKSQQVVERLISLGFKVEYHPTTYLHGSKYYDSLFYKE